MQKYSCYFSVKFCVALRSGIGTVRYRVSRKSVSFSTLKKGAARKFEKFGEQSEVKKVSKCSNVTDLLTKNIGTYSSTVGLTAVPLNKQINNFLIIKLQSYLTNLRERLNYCIKKRTQIILIINPTFTCGFVSHADQIGDGSELSKVGAEIVLLHILLKQTKLSVCRRAVDPD